MKQRLVSGAIAVTLLTGLSAFPGQTQASASQAQPGPVGSVLNVHALPRQQWLPGTGEAHRIIYRSTGTDGQPRPVSGVMFVPTGPAPEGGWPVLSWEHGTVGLADNCAPSTAGRSRRDLDYLSTWLAHGYAIVASDYAGLGSRGVHPYLDGRTAAYNATDMVRAAREVHDALSREWMAIGQSQGGGAALFTASLATDYAPELDFRGAVATGPASNVVELLTLLAGPDTPDILPANIVAYVANILRGLKVARPEFDLNSYLTPLGTAVVEDAARLCYPELKRSVQDITLADILRKPLSSGNFAELAHPVMDVPLGGYDNKFFIGHGTADADVPIQLTQKLVTDLTLRGVRFTYRSYSGADHDATMAESLSDTIPFVRRQFG